MVGPDIGIEENGMKFRYRAASIIIEDGKMLLLENDRDPYLYTVGGAVGICESSKDAACRECFEEIGVRYEPERLAVILEEFYHEPDRNGDMLDAHELGFFYFMKPRGTTEGILEKSYTAGFEERTVWIPLDELDRYTVVPSFLKDPDSYAGSLRHLVQTL